jgi:hypothetical protein
MKKIILGIFALIFLLAILGAKTIAYIILGIVAILTVLLTIIINRKQKPNAYKDWIKNDKAFDHETKSYKIKSRGFND